MRHLIPLLICTALTAAARADPPKPTLYLIGDSTVKNNDKGLLGWGAPITDLFDPTKITVANRALGGRSSRTFYTEGLWDKVLADLKPGDFVIMQFGHNDGGSVDKGDRPRASLKGNGDETRDVTVEKTGNAETVHTYGWYLRKYVGDAKAKGTTAIVCSPIPRNIWKDDKVARASGDYGKWAAEAAKQTGAFFIDLNEIIAARYEKEGQDKVKTEYFTAADHTHTTPAGAKVNAECVVDGIKSQQDCPLRQYVK
jgi:lysophospholipase L1-like esterase